MSGPHPETLGDYRVVSTIGRGGMGSVYVAEKVTTTGQRETFAVKVLHGFLGDEDDSTNDLLEEARIAAQIRHPNVVHVVETAQTADGVYLVMDYIEGTTLAKMVQWARRTGQMIPLPIVGRVLRDALAGLHAAHCATDDDGEPLNLVHRDFSPQNLLVGTDGITRLADFGIAKAAIRSGSTATGVVKGKLPYLSPEQAMAAKVDQRTDIWAAGVVLWEAITARKMFSGTGGHLIRKICEGPAPAPPSTYRDVPLALDDLVRAIVVRDRERRPPTAQACVELIDESFATVGMASSEQVSTLVRDIEPQRRAALAPSMGDEQEENVSLSATTLVASLEPKRDRPPPRPPMPTSTEELPVSTYRVDPLPPTTVPAAARPLPAEEPVEDPSTEVAEATHRLVRPRAPAAATMASTQWHETDSDSASLTIAQVRPPVRAESRLGWLPLAALAAALLAVIGYVVFATSFVDEGAPAPTTKPS